jgi:hypothetical protein
LRNDPFAYQGQPTQRSLGVPPMHRPGGDRPHLAAAFAGPPGLVDPVPLWSPPGHLGRTQAVIVARHHACAIELCGGAAVSGVQPEPPALGQTSRAPLATTGPQLTHPFALALALPCLYRSPGTREGSQERAAVSPRAVFLLRIRADHIAPTARTLSPHHVLAAPVVRHRRQTPRALADVVGDLGAASPRHPDDVGAPARAASLEGVLGAHPGLAHKDATAQFPPLQSVFAVGHRRALHGMAWQHPVSHWQAIAGPRQPAHPLRGIGTAILRQAPGAWRLGDLGTCRHAAFHQRLVTVARSDRVACQVPGRGSGAEQLPSKMAQSSEAAIERLCKPIFVGFE